MTIIINRGSSIEVVSQPEWARLGYKERREGTLNSKGWNLRN
jgi:hypothetical protein